MIMISITFLKYFILRFLEENKIALQNLQKEAKLLKERELAGAFKKAYSQIFLHLKTLFMQKIFQQEMYQVIILM